MPLTHSPSRSRPAPQNNREQAIVAQHNRPQSQSPCSPPSILFTKLAPEKIGRTQAPLPTANRRICRCALYRMTRREPSELLAFGSLARDQEGLRVFSF